MGQDSEYDNIGNILTRMKQQLKPNGSGRDCTGKYNGKDLEWWRENTRGVLDESILAFDNVKKRVDANALLEKLRAIRDASEEERERRMNKKVKGWNAGWIKVSPPTGGTEARIMRVTDKTKYYFGVAPEEGAAALKDSKYENIGSILHTMKKSLNPHGSGKGKNTGKYNGKDLEWWREKTRGVLDESILAFVPK